MSKYCISHRLLPDESLSFTWACISVETEEISEVKTTGQSLVQQSCQNISGYKTNRPIMRGIRLGIKKRTKPMVEIRLTQTKNRNHVNFSSLLPTTNLLAWWIFLHCIYCIRICLQLHCRWKHRRKVERCAEENRKRNPVSGSPDGPSTNTRKLWVHWTTAKWKLKQKGWQLPRITQTKGLQCKALPIYCGFPRLQKHPKVSYANKPEKSETAKRKSISTAQDRC